MNTKPRSRNSTYAISPAAHRCRIAAMGNGDAAQLPRAGNAVTPRASGMFLHFDGQFATARDLVIGTLTGRNFDGCRRKGSKPSRKSHHHPR